MDKTTEVTQKAKTMLDQGYLTSKGALYMILESFREKGIKSIDQDELVKFLNLSKATFYKARKEIESQQGWKLRMGRTLNLEE